MDLVWHPGAPRLVPIWTVEFLGSAVLEHEKAALRQNIRVAVFNLLVVAGLWAITHGKTASMALVLFFGLFFGVVPLVQNWRELRVLNGVNPTGLGMPITPIDRYAAWIETQSDTMTRWLLLIITLVGLAQVYVEFWYQNWARTHGYVVQSPSVALAGMVKELVRQGQWWRLFTAPLLHGGLVHYVFNATALLGLGRLTEALAGRHRLATVFAISAIGGSVFSQLAMPNTAASVGASGGLLGLVGFLLILGYRRKALLPPGFVKMFAFNIALVAVMGVAGHSIIDNAAHFGGLMTGVAVAAFMVPPEGGLPLPESRGERIAGIVSFGAILGFAVVAVGKLIGRL